MGATADIRLKTHWTTLVQRVREKDIATAEELETWLRTLEREVKAADAIVRIGDTDVVVPAKVKTEIERLRATIAALGKPVGFMVRWNRQPRYDEVKYFEREREASDYKHELDENGWTDPELIPLYAKTV